MPIRNAVLAAMQILSQEFVIGKNFKDIQKLPGLEKEAYSFDMLGEAARTPFQAENYFESYLNALSNTISNTLSNTTFNTRSNTSSNTCSNTFRRFFRIRC